MNSFCKRFSIAMSVVFLFASTAFSFVAMDGYFIAEQECPAYQSIRNQTNPGDVAVVKGMAYEVLGKNKAMATHYQVKVEGAEPSARWVSNSCGILLTDCTVGEAQESAETEKSPEYLLAISWQPAFCQTHQAKKECETQTEGRYDADHFALHGLWPQPKGNYYCGVNEKNKKLDEHNSWEQLPSLNLSDSTFNLLMEVMPGTASYLQRHEWYKHGSCYDDPAETYFLESISLVEQVNDSTVRDLFAGAIGQSLTSAEIREKFDEAFGSGAGQKVQIKCDAGMISEMWINLKGKIETDTPIADLLKEGQTVGAGCDGGRIDRVGF